MASLFNLAHEYIEVARNLEELELDEQTIKDTLDSISGDLEEKAKNIAMMILNFESIAEAIKASVKRQKERADSIDSKAERLRDYLEKALIACNLKKVETPEVLISFRKSSAIVIDDASLIPFELMRHPPAPAPEPDKKLIAEAFKNQKIVPGARKEERDNLQLK